MRQWRWWLGAAATVVVVSAFVASRSDDVGSGGSAQATASTRVPSAPSVGIPVPDVTASQSPVTVSPVSPTGTPVPSSASGAVPPASQAATVAPGGASGVPPTPSPVPAAAPEGDRDQDAVPSTSRPGAAGPGTSVPPPGPGTTSPRPTATSSVPSTTGPAALPDTSEPDAGTSVVDQLGVANEAPRSGYDRSLFPHWSDLDGNGCTTRQDMLFASVRGFPQVDLFDSCVIVEGDWYSVYDGVLHAGQPGDLDVDHVVALAEAWDSGAWAWSEGTRRRFANDPDNLLVVTASSNRSKSDQDLGEWRPARRDAWCLTADITARIKARYGLSVDPAEARALRDMLAECDRSGTVTVPAPPVAAPSVPVVTTAAPVPSTAPPAIVPSAPCIDLNTASTSELEEIIHIGPSRAAEIVRLRPFASVADLDRVSGIGPSRLSDIVDQGRVCP